MGNLFRVAEPADVLFIGRLLREFYRKQGEVYGVTYDHESTLNTVGKVIRQGLCLVGPSSVAGAIFGPFPYNEKAVIAYVPFWYFRSAREMRVLEELAKACREAGAHRINVASHPPDHRIGRLYERLGMRMVEGQWFGNLENPCTDPESR